MLMKIMDRTGDTEVDTAIDVDLAKSLFEEAMRSGKMAYAKRPSGKNVQVLTWEEAVIEEEIVLAPMHVGG